MRWVALALTVVVATGIDLFAHRGERRDALRWAIAWSGYWIVVALLFGTCAAFECGVPVATNFFSAYVLEKALSVDNLLVFLLIFTRLRIPATEQRRVLFWGIGGAVIMRGTFIAAGIAMTEWRIVLLGFGLFLVVAGVRLAWGDAPPTEPRLVGWLRRHLPLSKELVGHRFFTRQDGRYLATPLLLALFAIELTDVLFAVDSIPAALGITREPFTIFSSNILAVLGLRAHYVVVAALLERMRFLRFGVAALLVFVGAKTVFAPWVSVRPHISFAVIACVLTITALASLLPQRERKSRE